MPSAGPNDVRTTTAGAAERTRTKAKIKATRIPYRLPSAPDLPARVSGVLDGYHAYHATRAELLRRPGRASEAYSRAIDLAGNTVETAYLTRRRNQLA
jgi:predicted RNA polymerase sigma factor